MPELLGSSSDNLNNRHKPADFAGLFFRVVVRYKLCNQSNSNAGAFHLAAYFYFDASMNELLKLSSRLIPGAFILTLVFAVIVSSAAAAASASDETRSANQRHPSTYCEVHTSAWQSSVTTIQAQSGYEWRKTQQGWIQVPMGNVPSIHKLRLPSYQPGIHPINVTAMMVLLSLGVMAWASDEWDWSRFVSESA